MKNLIGLVILITFIAFTGCSEKTQSPVAPKENPAPLSKLSIERATVNQYSVRLIDPGVRRIINGRMYWGNLRMEDRFVSSNPLLQGTVINTANITEDVTTGNGYIAGTLTVTPDANVGGGRWEIAYAGKVEATGPTTTRAPIKGIGRGVGGTINGMLYTAEFVVYAEVSSAGISWEGNGNVLLTNCTRNNGDL